MIFYFNIKKSSQINPHVIFISIMKYIFIIAGLKFIEKKNDIVGFFNIYIGLVLIIDICFSCYNYIQNTYLVVHTNLSKSKILDFETQIDDLIDSKFNLKDYNQKLNSMIKKKSVKIIKKDNSESENDLKEFNKNISLNQLTQTYDQLFDIDIDKQNQEVLHISSLEE